MADLSNDAGASTVVLVHGAFAVDLPPALAGVASATASLAA